MLVGTGVLLWALVRNDGALDRRNGITLMGLSVVFVVGRLLSFPGQ